MRVCHPASFAGEGSAVRKKAKEKQIPHPAQKPSCPPEEWFMRKF